MSDTNIDLTRVIRAESGRILAALISISNDLQLAEDAIQDATVQALEQWRSSIPDNPGAWLFTVAKRRLLDHIKKIRHRTKPQTIQAVVDFQFNDESSLENSEHSQIIPDERLKLIFTCCHPALSREAQVALTLKTLCGLSTNEIARAFLTSKTTMDQRLVRAKKKIRLAKIPYRVPEHDQLHSRLSSVLSVIYLIYNESYSVYEGQSLTRKDLSLEAIRLARLVFKLLKQAEAGGLLALLLFHQSRFEARQDKSNAFIPLEKHNRKLWDKNKIKEANKLLDTVIVQNQPGPYQVQAAISALHAEARDWTSTDWPQIILLYQSLNRIEPNPVVELNWYMAVAYSGNLQEALRGLSPLRNPLKDYQPFYAARAYVNKCLGDHPRAVLDYQKAIKLSQNAPEKDYLICELKKLKNSSVG